MSLHPPVLPLFVPRPSDLVVPAVVETQLEVVRVGKPREQRRQIHRTTRVILPASRLEQEARLPNDHPLLLNNIANQSGRTLAMGAHAPGDTNTPLSDHP